MYVEFGAAGALIGAVAACGLRRPMFALAAPPGGGGPGSSPRCPHCGADPIGTIPALHGKCTRCGARIGPRWGSLEIGTAGLCATIALGSGPRIETVGFLSVAAVGVALAVVDVRSLRLPNKLILLAALPLAASLLAAAAIDGSWSRLQSGVLGAIGLSLAYLLLAIIRPGQLGLGDVKLALPLGLLLGWFGWPFVVFGGCLPFLLSALTILVLLVLRKITLRSHIPFGPFMLAGALLALVL